MDSHRSLLTDERVRPFLQELRSRPMDDAPRLVFADWLEDHDQPGLASFVRLENPFAGPTSVVHQGELWPFFRVPIRAFQRLCHAHGVAPDPSQPNVPERVPLRFDLDAGSTTRYELPFVVGVLADLSGTCRESLPPLAERKFFEIDVFTFDDVFRECTTRFVLDVPNHLEDDSNVLHVELSFSRFQDLAPSNIVRQVPRLRELPNKVGSLLESNSEEVEREVLRLARRFSRQLSAILHHPEVQRFEATWHGLAYLVDRTDTGPDLKIGVLNVCKEELFQESQHDSRIETRSLFRKIAAGFATGKVHDPFGAFVVDYEFSHEPSDMSVLQYLAGIGAHVFAPFLAGTSPSMFGCSNFTELGDSPLDPRRFFQNPEYAAWKVFRHTEAASYVALTLPRVLARRPYGPEGLQVAVFPYDESIGEADLENTSWMNPAWTLAVNLTRSFARFSWFVHIYGIESAGPVEGLSTLPRATEFGEGVAQSATDLELSDHRTYEFQSLGFLPLVRQGNLGSHYFADRKTCYLLQHTTHPQEQVQAEEAVRLDYQLCRSRILHYVRTMACSRLKTFGADEVERWLNDWLAQYCSTEQPTQGQSFKVQHPLREGLVELRQNPDSDNLYDLTLWITICYQVEPLGLCRFTTTISTGAG